MKKRLSVKLSSPKEFDRYFPRGAMISTRPGPNAAGGRGGGRGGLNAGNGRHMSPPAQNIERGRAPAMRGDSENGRGRSRSPINRRRDSNAGGDSFDRRRSL